MSTSGDLFHGEKKQLGPIYVTETFMKQVLEIYGRFTPRDAEYPTLGVVIQGTPIFIRCIQIPDAAIERHMATDYMHMDHPDAQKVWKQELRIHGGKVRFSTTHIHPMNLPSLSSYDKQQFESVRTAPNTLNPFDVDHPMPVILINLDQDNDLVLIGFWVYRAQAVQVAVMQLSDSDARVSKAFDNAEPLPFFSKEAAISENVNEAVRKAWSVGLGCHKTTGAKALQAIRNDGAKVMLKFSAEAPFGLTHEDIEAGALSFASYVDWSRLLDDLVTVKQANITHSMVASQTTCTPSGLTLTIPPEAAEVSRRTWDLGIQKENSTHKRVA